MIHFPTIKKLLQPFKTKYLAVSGGNDSMVMLDILSKIYPGDELVACYFEHNPENPRGEADFIQEQLSKKKRWKNIKFETWAFIDGFSQFSFEADARNQRYNWLTSLVDKQSDCVVTAHHKDDQVETVLYRLFTNRKITGIKENLIWTNDVQIIRPFLSFPKKELEAWRHRHQLLVMDDPTNSDIYYADRNFIRNEILQKISNRFGNQDHLIKLLEG